MGWVTIRIALAHLLPGFIPTLLFFSVMMSQIEPKIFETTGGVITVYILSSIVLGIVIDLMRHKFEKIFINWLNLTWLRYIFALIISKIKKHPVGYLPLKRSFQNYNEKEKESIKLWLSLQLEKHKEVNEKIKANVILEREYNNPTITSGDRWAILNILEKDSLRFMMEEYFSYYEFSFNCMVSITLTELINLYFLISGQLTNTSFWIITVVCFIFIITFHELSVFWLLATKRFTRKLILFSLIK
ncbi:MAG: hypothetical protein K9K37_11475 [Desulfocapsa sp.]|nr:hypothetical protein [Desulfocapsa sp.]